MHLARPSLGTAQLLRGYGIAGRRGGRPPRDEPAAVLGAAFEGGIRSLDTAPGYGDAESTIGSLLRREGRPDGLELCTKLPALPPALTPRELLRAVEHAVEGSRRRLRTETIDHYLVHRAGDLEEHGSALVDALLVCRARGWIRHVGVSVYDPSEASASLAWSCLESVQFPFNVLDRRFRESGDLRGQKHSGRVTFARSPLLQGLLGLPPGALPAPVERAARWLETFRGIARRHGRGAAGVALAFSAGQPMIDHVVFGVDGVGQLGEAIEAFREPLPAALVGELERAFPDVPPEIVDPRRWEARP